ncbi:MAG: hypothetical protein IH946_03180, partial [Bacteroidetes bacterium]|nr:hypothetical protein [Bacteroidota bacterium]
MNNELTDCKKELQRSKQELEDFVYIVSHDLKAPLRAISTLSSFIEEDIGDVMTDEVTTNFKLLKSRVERLQNMMEA